ncbi:MAG: hypothetical protein Q7T85_09375 [Nitrosomonas sp.]|nr:hypothetical protein [Nitrosomonas sp.]
MIFLYRGLGIIFITLCLICVGLVALVSIVPESVILPLKIRLLLPDDNLIRGMVVAAVFGGIIGGLRGIFGIVGRQIYNSARKLESMHLSDELEKDKRPHVLYLRSFTDDPITAARGIIQRGAWFFPTVKTEEEQLVQILSSIGPVVAVGKPGEALP